MTTAVVALFVAAFAVVYWKVVIRLVLVAALFFFVVGVGAVLHAVGATGQPAAPTPTPSATTVNPSPSVRLPA